MDDHLLMCCADPQLSLSNAIDRRDIAAFRDALRSSADAESYNVDTKLSIFEYACQTPGCHEFIVECINARCDVNKINPELNKRPINFAAESLCSENIAAISTFPTVDLDAKYEDSTPLNTLAKLITDENFQTVSKSIECLLDRGANVNLANRREMAPIHTVIGNRKLSDRNKQRLIAEILRVPSLDLDAHRKGEARKFIESEYPHLDLPPLRPANELWDFQKLMASLRNEREAEFLVGIAKFAQSHDAAALQSLFRESEGDDTLLVMAAKKDSVAAAERMLRLGADPNYSVRRNMTPVEAACIYGHWRMVEMLLRTPQLNVHTSDPLLSIIVKKIGEKVTNKCNYDKCFQLLINRPGISVDEEDIFKCSALHYAIKYNNHDAIAELLKRGAYIGVKNHFNRFSVSDISPKVLERHLDSCITTNNFRMGDDNFEIVFDYANLVPPSMKRNAFESSAKSGSSSVCADEMAPLEFISQTKELKHLIMHPLITSFLFLKWHRLAFIFYVNFLLYLIFAVNIISYILVCYHSEPPSKPVEATMWTVSTILGCCIFMRELFQMVLSPRIYFKSIENYLEIGLIVFTALILSKIDFDEGRRRTFAAITILLVVAELVILVGSLPFMSFSTHLVMLQTVTVSFMRSLLLYAIILIAFSMCFFTLLNEPRARAPATPDADDDDDEFNKFNNPMLSILKTVVMMTGEFDAASINFNLNASSYFVFLIFVFLISTVLFNLLNGLAVSDIQVIKSEAELTNFVSRCQLTAHYEKILLGNDCQCFIPVMKLFLRSRISLFKEFLPLHRVSVQPNAGNQVLIHVPLSKASTPGDVETMSLREEAPLVGCSKHCCSMMERKIVKGAIQLLDRQQHGQNEDDQLELILSRIKRLDEAVAELTQQIRNK